MRRNLAAVAVVCSLLWVVSGVSALALTLHEHGHHVEDHDHHDAIQTVLHGHAHESLPDHDHELTAPLMASRMFSSARRMLINSLRAEHPDWDEQQINREAARRLSHGAV